MNPVAVIRHPTRKHFHASLNCAYGKTASTDEQLIVTTETAARTAGRRPCVSCWTPEGYVVIPDNLKGITFKEEVA